MNFRKFKIRQSFFSPGDRRRKQSSLKSLIFLIAIFIVPLAFAQSPVELKSPPEIKAPYKVAIIPVKIHSPENLGFLREGLVDMLSSRVELEGRVTVLEKGPVQKAFDQVSGEINGETAKKIGQLLEADFVVFGSLTKLGDSASLDLKIVGVKEEKPGFSVFIQARKMEEIVASVDQLARQIDEKILGYPLKPQVAAKPSGDGERNNRGIFHTGDTGRTRTDEGARSRGTGEFWQSQPFPFYIKGMAVGDVDGDGRNEVVLISERKLHIYRWDGEFKRVWEKEGGRLDSYLAVDVADMDKDGKAEIFVTNIQGDRLASFVVAFKDGSFRNGFLRPVLVFESGGMGGKRKGFAGTIQRGYVKVSSGRFTNWGGMERPIRKSARPIFLGFSASMDLLLSSAGERPNTFSSIPIFI